MEKEQTYYKCPWDEDNVYLKEAYEDKVLEAIKKTANANEALTNITVGDLIWRMETPILDTVIDFLIEVASARDCTEKFPVDEKDYD